MVRKSRLFALCSLLAFAGAFLALTACGSDSSTSSKGESVNVFDSEDNLPECSDSLGLDSAYVGADSSLYVCADGKWTAADSSDVEKSSSSEAKNSSGSNGSSSSVNGSSSSKGASSSSDAPGTETLYVCEDHVNDISLKLYDDTLAFRFLIPYEKGIPVGDDAAEKEALENFQTAAGEMAATFKSLSEDELCGYSASLCALVSVDTAYEVAFDDSFRMGFSFRLPDSKVNRNLVKLFRIERSGVESSEFDNSDCKGGWISRCLADDRNLQLSYLYPDDSLRLAASFVIAKTYEDFSDVYSERYYPAIQNIEKAATEEDAETLATLTGLEKESPWVSLLKGGVRFNHRIVDLSGETQMTVTVSVNGYDKKEFADAIMREECLSSEDFWMKKLFESETETSSSSGTSSSSSSESSSSSSSAGLVVSYGEVKDVRDANVYKTVKIGSQVWMAENLNLEYNEGTATSHCYNDNADSCAKYGRLYTWAAAMDSAAVFSDDGKGCGFGATCSASGTVRGVCPEGWHLPSEVEWDTLINYVDRYMRIMRQSANSAGYALKSTSGWKEYYGKSANGSDLFGFGALPAGYRYDSSSSYIFELTFFWSSTEEYADKVYNLALLNSNSDVRKITGVNTDKAGSVRCVKD